MVIDNHFYEGIDVIFRNLHGTRHTILNGSENTYND